MLTSEGTLEAVGERVGSGSGHQGSVPGPACYAYRLGQATNLSVSQFPPL